MSISVFKNNFTAGEWSPLLDGRSDLQGYGAACRRLENLRPMPQGGVRLRGGLEFVREAWKGNSEVRLVAFTFSTSTRYVLEWGDKYVRVFRADGSRAAGPITTTYGAEDVFGLQFKQLNDWLYIVHGEHAPRKLARLGDTNWVLSEVEWDYPALRDENTEDARRLRFENGVLTASGFAPFTAGDVGGYYELRHYRQGSEVELTLYPHSATVSASIAVRGDWEFLTTEFWWGTIFLERSRDNGVSWEVMRQWRGQSDRNISTGGRVDEEDAEQLMRIRYASSGAPFWPPAMNGVSGDAPTGWKHSLARLEVKEIYARGLVRVTGYSSPTSVAAVVVGRHAPVSAGWTDRWSEGAWSKKNGFPRAVGLFEQRLIFGGSRAQAIRFWGSRSGDFENFQRGDRDSAGFAFDIASSESNPILWIESTQRLCIGTSGGEYTAGGGSVEAPISPSNVAVRFSSSYGSVGTQPVRVGEDVLFIERQGKTIRELGYELQRDGFSARNLSVTAEHLFEGGGAVELAFARAPHPQVFAPNGGESLAVLTHDAELNVGAWARYTSGLDGRFESVCVIYGEPVDEVWCVVRRRVNGTWKRFIERFTPEVQDKHAARYLDCHTAGVAGVGNAWNGGLSLGHGALNGETVRVVLGGVVVGDFKVNGSGVHVPDAVRDNFRAVWAAAEAKEAGSSLPLRAWCVGLPYRGVVESMRIEVESERGASAGRLRRITKVTPRFDRTGGVVRFGAGESVDALEAINFRQADDAFDEAVSLFSGDVPLAFRGGHDREGRIVFATEAGQPFTLLGCAIEIGNAG